MNWKNLFIGAILWGLASIALAQSTLGEVLDAGGKQLTKEDVMNSLVGATISGARPDGGTVEFMFKADGSTTGTVQAGLQARGRSGSIYGTWTVDDTGKMCRDVTIRVVDARQVKDCFFFYRVGDQYYVTDSDSKDRSAPAQKRIVNR